LKPGKHCLTGELLRNLGKLIFVSESLCMLITLIIIILLLYGNPHCEAEIDRREKERLLLNSPSSGQLLASAEPFC
jgi:hypothetical protein